MVDDLRRDLYVGNVSEKVSEDVLYELFLQAGPLESVRIPTDKNTGVQKQFAFVSYVHEESVAYSKHLLDGIQLYGKPLKVQPKEVSFQNKPADQVGIHSLGDRESNNSDGRTNYDRSYNTNMQHQIQSVVHPDYQMMYYNQQSIQTHQYNPTLSRDLLSRLGNPVHSNHYHDTAYSGYSYSQPGRQPHGYREEVHYYRPRERNSHQEYYRSQDPYQSRHENRSGRSHRRHR